jgi:hypothetical protein
VLVPRYKLSLCHTSIKLDLLGFPGIGVFACRLRDHVMSKCIDFYFVGKLRQFPRTFMKTVRSNSDVSNDVLFRQ